MKRFLAVLAVVVGAGGVAHAQPGLTPVQPYPAPPAAPAPPGPYPAQPYPAPQGLQAPYAPPPYGYQQVPLSFEDRELLARGEISESARIGGAALGFVVGFGTGHAVQGRWSDNGWMFALGEGVAVIALFAGLLPVLGDCFDEDCRDDRPSRGQLALALAGGIGFTGLRVWEIADTITGPDRHNRQVRELRQRLGIAPPVYWGRIAPYVGRTRDGATAGLTLRF